MPTQPLPLKDIKPIVAVPDHSLWLFSALIVAALLAVAAIVYALVRYRRSRIDRVRVEAFRRLDAIDYSNTKTAVYDFSLLGHFVVTPKTEAAFASLLADLNAYKFRKTVPALDEATRERMRTFIREARRG